MHWSAEESAAESLQGNMAMFIEGVDAGCVCSISVDPRFHAYGGARKKEKEFKKQWGVPSWKVRVGFFFSVEHVTVTHDPGGVSYDGKGGG
jgi:hypothetical protein